MAVNWEGEPIGLVEAPAIFGPGTKPSAIVPVVWPAPSALYWRPTRYGLPSPGPLDRVAPVKPAGVFTTSRKLDGEMTRQLQRVAGVGT